jgi:hypothetical protein
MKLLKKIAPFAISTLMIGASMAGAVALNIADWKTQFSNTNTAVVVGTGVTDAGDIAGALTAAKAVGIDTTSSTVTGESYAFQKTSDKLNLGNLLTDIRSSLTNDQMPTTLADGVYKDASSSEYEYTQKITLGTALRLMEFADNDYNDKAPTLGINMTDDQHIMNYTLTFTDKPDFTAAALETTTIDMMGKTYYISDIDVTNKIVTLLDSSTSGIVKEGETITIGGEAITLYFVSSTPTVKLKIGDTITNSMAAGATYKLSNGNYIGVKDIMYVAKDTGSSSAELTVGTGKIKVYDNYTSVKINEKTVEGLKSDIGLSTDQSDLQTITFAWDLENEAYVTSDSSVLLPGLEAVKLMMTGMVFPTGEEIDVEAGSSDVASIKIPFKDGMKEVDLLHSNTTHFNAIGGDTDELLVTSRERYLVFNKSANAKYFIASYQGTTDAESYLISATFNNVDDKVTLKNEITGSDICTIATEGECSVGQVDLTSNLTSDNYVNLSINSGGHFDRVFTSKGGMFFLPVNASSGHGYINLATGFNPGTTWVLEMWDQNKDQTIESDSSLNITFGHNTDTDVHVSTLTGAIGTYGFEEKDKYYLGYVPSDLATKVEWDKTGNQYTAKVTYYGDEVYGNVFIAAAGASGGSTSWTPVQDSETDKYVSKNIVVIGGTAVNKVARKMLGLDEATPVYGTEAGWTETGVTAAGKGILWMKTSPYTEGTGKYALLVAGWTGTDTEKSANYLQLKASTAAKEKVVIDTNALVEAS